MTAYYNEFDGFAADWLENLIHAGLIAPGVVDRRSIEDVTPDDLRDFTQCHFFAGIGVWSYALRRAGWSDDRPVWTASCPCQPFSSAGAGAGSDDERHLWPAVEHLMRVRRPPIVFGEQVASAAATACSGWPTPAASDGKGGYQGGRIRNGKLSTDRLDVCAQLTVTGETPIGSAAGTVSGGQLNPEHSRWLMGLPPEWDACAPMVTRSTRRRPSHSSRPQRPTCGASDE